MSHIVIPEAEAWVDREIPVLDKGFVRLVDYMGGDARIVQAARVSYGMGAKSAREDAALIDYLLRHQHTSPFEHVVFEFHCKMPIFVARQWIRHRTARINEISGRYTVMTDEFYVPPSSQVRRQSADNKQGRDADEVPPELRRRVLELLRRDQEAAYGAYEELLKDDIARELARINLPLSLYTQWYWQMDLHNLFHFLALRIDEHAQWEIREYAHAIAKVVEVVCPLAYAAFERHVLRGCRLSCDEIEAVRRMIKGQSNPLTGRRLAEFERKLFGDIASEPVPGGIVAEPASPEREPSPERKAAERGVPSHEAGAVAAAGATSDRVHGLRISMTSDEINALPLRHYEGPVEVVSGDAEVAAMLKRLRQEKIVGFDTESRPAFRPGESFPVSIVQLAAADTVYLVQIRKLAHPKKVFEFFEDPAILKVGVALDQDLRKLREMQPFEAAGFVDISRIAARIGLRKSGLRGLAAILLGFRVSKGAQRSNWSREALSSAQIIYAATDAWVSRELYVAFVARGLTVPAEAGAAKP